MSDTTDRIASNNQPFELIFEKRYDQMTWGYACPFRDGESPTQAFLRVLNHIIDVLPELARPDYFFATDQAGVHTELRDIPERTDAWQHLIREAIPPAPWLEADLGLILKLQTATGQQFEKLSGNGISIEHPGLVDPEDTLANTITVDLRIYFDVYDPVPPDADPARIKQAEYNRPRLTKFLTSIRDDLNGQFVFRDYPEVGPLGVLEEDAPQDGLPPW